MLFLAVFLRGAFDGRKFLSGIFLRWKAAFGAGWLVCGGRVLLECVYGFVFSVSVMCMVFPSFLAVIFTWRFRRLRSSS